MNDNVALLERSDFRGAAAPEKPLASFMEDRLGAYAESVTRLSSERVAETAGYFTTPDAILGVTPLERMAHLYTSLERPIISDEAHLFDEAVRIHSEELVGRAFDQQSENPLSFLSHGFNHTLNVAEYAEQITAENPAIITTIASRYQVTEGLAKFLLDNVILFHDTGYRYLKGRAKAVHALVGADMVSSDKVRGALATLIQSQNKDADVERILHDVSDAILFHNADTVQQQFDARIETTRGNFLVDKDNLSVVVSKFTTGDIETETPARQVTKVYVPDMSVGEDIVADLTQHGVEAILFNAPEMTEEASRSAVVKVIVIGQAGRKGKPFRGRVLDLEAKDDKKLGVEYKQVELLEAPLQAVIRLADNMDMRATRFIGPQRLPAFQEAYRRFGDGGEESRVLRSLEQIASDLRQEVNGFSNAERMIKTADVRDESLAVLEEAMTEEERERFFTDLGTIGDPAMAEKVWKEIILERIFMRPENGLLSQQEKEDITEYALALDSHQLKHFGGCEAIDRVFFVGNTVTIRVDRDRYNTLNETKVTEHMTEESGDIIPTQVGVGEYQIWRLRQAYKSVLIEGKSIEVHVVDTEGESIEGDLQKHV